MHAVVQIVALRQRSLGNLSPAWTGSGTIVAADGVILTNCHVVSPRSMGMSSPQADVLAIAITQRSDEPPALTYLADIVALSPELDLAVLRIVAGLDGRPVAGLDLPFVPLGDSDTLELADELYIFGYPGIGGETVTFTRGSVSGFSSEAGVRDRRAWIKTDATIAGGNSGGAAINQDGMLVGVPTQAAAGSGIQPVDARPVIDTNRDGRVDQRDMPMAVGGFINGLRPINLARPLLEQSGVSTSAERPRAAAAPVQPSQRRAAPAKPGQKQAVPAQPGRKRVAPAPQGGAVRGPVFSTLLFSRGVTRDGRPVHLASVLPSGGKEIFCTFDFDGMRNGTTWTQVWAKDGEIILSQEEKWTDGPRGRKTLVLGNPQGLADGEYHLVLAVKGQIVAEGSVVVGRRITDTDTQVSGMVVDQITGRGIANATVIALRPGVSVREFLRYQSQDMVYTSAVTDHNGQFTFPQQLPKGQAYGLIIAAQQYQGIAIEAALRIGADAPEYAQIEPIPLARG